jgi:hypothetical protein
MKVTTESLLFTFASVGNSDSNYAGICPLCASNIQSSGFSGIQTLRSILLRVSWQFPVIKVCAKWTGCAVREKKIRIQRVKL